MVPSSRGSVARPEGGAKEALWGYGCEDGFEILALRPDCFVTPGRFELNELQKSLGDKQPPSNYGTCPLLPGFQETSGTRNQNSQRKDDAKGHSGGAEHCWISTSAC